MRNRNVAIVVAIALVLGACSKGEPKVKKTSNAAPAQVAQDQSSAAAATSNGSDSVEALKERLARQEAASKMFDAPKPVAAPAPTVAKTDPAPQPRIESVPAKPLPTPAPPKSEPVKAEPVQVASTAPVQIPAVRSEPAKVESAPQPRTDLALAKPAMMPTSLTPKVLERVSPEFPREAIQAGADEGLVKARMTLDVSGNVTRVEVLESIPRRLFDRAVVRALSQWRFNDGPSGRTFETEVAFKR